MNVKAKIFRSDQRGLRESEDFRRLSTFNCDDDCPQNHTAFGTLVALNDETLRGGHSLLRHVQEPAYILTLPLVGGLIVRDSSGESTLATQQIGLIVAQAGQSYVLTNPFRDELVNYLQIWISAQSGTSNPASVQSDFSLSERNRLVALLERKPFDGVLIRLCIGVYDGRKKDHYHMQDAQNGLFAFVLNGAFELEDRLIENRDGLALWNLEIAEFEALSEHAMLLLIEIPLS